MGCSDPCSVTAQRWATLILIQKMTHSPSLHPKHPPIYTSNLHPRVGRDSIHERKVRTPISTKRSGPQNAEETKEVSSYDTATMTSRGAWPSLLPLASSESSSDGRQVLNLDRLLS